MADPILRRLVLQRFRSLAKEQVQFDNDGSNAASVLREIQRKSAADWKRIGELLASVVPGTVGIHLKRRGNKLALAFSQDWGKPATVKFEALNMSDGTLRVLGMLAAIFQRPAPSLIVIEEPEATVHPAAIGAILDVLRHAGRSMQVVATTHSPDVLDARWMQDRHLRIASLENGTTRIRTVSSSVKVALREHLMGAGELLRANAMTAAEASEPEKGQFELFVKTT